MEVKPEAPLTPQGTINDAMLTATRNQLSAATKENLGLLEKVRGLETKLASAKLYGDTMEMRVKEVQAERAGVSAERVTFLEGQVKALSDRICTETDFSRYLKEELDGKAGLVAALTGDVKRITKQREKLKKVLSEVCVSLGIKPPLESFENLLRDLVEKVRDIEKLRESNKQYADGLAARTSDLSNALRKAAEWKVEAARQQRNVEYYRDTVVEIGQLFGSLAYISDDGTVNDTVLCAKVPDLVKALITGNWSGIATPPVIKALSINAPTLASGAISYEISDNAVDYKVEASPALAARVEFA